MSAVTLWHVPISHYSEKVRWALDFKRIPHTRRRLLGGLHPPVTWLLTRGAHQTVPVVTIDGQGHGDSTAIVAELERRFPARPLYPADPEQRARALALEEWFDEELGPYLRRLAYHEVTSDPKALADLTYMQVPTVRRPWLAPTMRGLTLFLDRRFGVRDAGRAREAEAKVLAALDRLEAELGGRPLLCGDALSVADVTAASLLYGLVLPPEGPWQPEYVPPAWRERIERLAGRPALRWVRETYAHHRLPA